MTESTVNQPSSQPVPPELPDHRQAVFAAQDWVAAMMAEVGPEQYGRPTPCTEFDVQTLLGHLYGVADRLIVMGAGHPAESMSAQVASLPEDVVAGYRERIAAGRSAWADDASLTRLIEVPWGRAPAAVVLSVYLAENLAHGWDLAVATGQDPEADPRLAERALQIMSRVLPAEGRDDFPFDDPVAPAPDASPTERLANWMGRARPAAG